MKGKNMYCSKCKKIGNTPDFIFVQKNGDVERHYTCKCGHEYKTIEHNYSDSDSRARLISRRIAEESLYY